MAKIERKKLSRDAIKNSNKNNKWWTNKKNLIISIIAGIVVIGVAVGFILYYALKSDDEETTYDYFVSAENSDGETVEFTKASYRGLQMLASSENPLFEDYIIVFVYDSTQFYPDESDDEDNYNKTHDDILLKMANLQTDVNNAKKNDDSLNLDLYIVDTSVGENADIFSDDVFYANSEVDYTTDDTYTVSILLLVDGVLLTKFDYSTDDGATSNSRTIFATDAVTANNTAIGNLSLYVQTQLK